MKRQRIFWALLIVLALIVFSVVTLRTDDTQAGGEQPFLIRFAIGVLYALCAVAPAFGGEMVMRALLVSRRLARELGMKDRALAAVADPKAGASKEIRKVARATESWDYWATRGRNRYAKIWKAERAKHAPVTDPTGPTPSKT